MPARTPTTATPDDDPLRDYEALEAASAEMVAAARDGDWSRVTDIEHAAARLIDRLRGARDGAACPPGGEQARRRLRIMRRIVLNDAAVRELAEPWLHGLGTILSGGRNPDPVEASAAGRPRRLQ